MDVDVVVAFVLGFLAGVGAFVAVVAAAERVMDSDVDRE